MKNLKIMRTNCSEQVLHNCCSYRGFIIITIFVNLRSPFIYHLHQLILASLTPVTNEVHNMQFPQLNFFICYNYSMASFMIVHAFLRILCLLLPDHIRNINLSSAINHQLIIIVIPWRILFMWNKLHPTLRQKRQWI